MVDKPTISRLYVPQGTKVISREMPTNSGIRLFVGEFSAGQLYDAVAAARRKLSGVYNTSLDATYFLGCWAEEPTYAAEDYRSYAKWLRDSSEYPDEADTRKFALIGANRLWGTVKTLVVIIDERLIPASFHRTSQVQFIETGAVVCPDGLFARTRPIRDTFYDDKRVYFANPPKNHGIGLRPVSTYELDAVNVPPGRLDLNAGLIRELFSYYRQFHAAITNNEAEVAVTVSSDGV